MWRLAWLFPLPFPFSAAGGGGGRASTAANYRDLKPKRLALSPEDERAANEQKFASREDVRILSETVRELEAMITGVERLSGEAQAQPEQPLAAGRRSRLPAESPG